MNVPLVKPKLLDQVRHATRFQNETTQFSIKTFSLRALRLKRVKRVGG